ncbi:MAG: hypothetical protein FJ006_08685 [Chloroflexi bacterium]|nr:hypothetical protein [Chloroflexota bacterium]
MSGEPPLLCFAMRVIAKASLLLQMQNECPYLLNPYHGDIGGEALSVKKIIKVSHAVNDNGYCVWALTFSLSTDRIAWDEV